MKHLVLLTSLLLLSCRQGAREEPLTMERIFYYRNGVVHSMGSENNDGLPHGTWQSYFADGTLRWKGQYLDGRFAVSTLHPELKFSSDTVSLGDTIGVKYLNAAPGCAYSVHTDAKRIHTRYDMSHSLLLVPVHTGDNTFGIEFSHCTPGMPPAFAQGQFYVREIGGGQ